MTYDLNISSFYKEEKHNDKVLFKKKSNIAKNEQIFINFIVYTLRRSF